MDENIRALERKSGNDPDAALLLMVANRRAGKPAIHPLGEYGDWESAFGNDGAKVPELYPEVAISICQSPGENDGPSWIGIFRLFDGRYVGINSSCDYTGWG